MSEDLFISYAWTSDEHREWVRLLAANLKAAGYDVLVDVDLDYGDGLTGFMRRAVDCRHVLAVVDENYVDRADHLPGSGVGIENKWFREVRLDRPTTWLSVLFKDNPKHRLPAWLAPCNPKSHSFNAAPATGDFPGSEQVEELWRWIEDLPANRDHAATVATLRARGKRLERVDRQRDPNSWANPSTEAEVHFDYERSPGHTYGLGVGVYGFKFNVSGRGPDSVYVYKDYIHAVGLNRTGASAVDELAAQLTPGRYVEAAVGQQVILQNDHGAVCVLDVLDVQAEQTEPTYLPESIRFRYRILLDS
ncbi:MAG: toll/interleukin-1 receptor domain-containing protein [Propionibacteriaceae bacterium]|nr:toll/interleukin-1 receptor domain-containing protein [Propionibacteriaceae bacterium]